MVGRILLIILGILVGIIVLIMLIPVGADLRYEDGVVRISLKAAGIRLQLLPRKKREPKEQKPKKEKKPKPEKPKEEKPPKKKRSLPFNLEEILELLKTVLKGFGRFGRKFKVERFVLHWIAPAWNPYDSARFFAVVNAGLSQLAPICSERFQCRDSSVWTDIDFTREEMFLELGLTFTIRIGQIVGTLLSIAFGALKILLRSKRRAKREAREEAAALETWLKEHPEDAARLREEEEARKRGESGGMEAAS
ncbi:MAG: hypothetical protein K6C12_12825 [Oscillospiraceae bacterium]|nr:hypothetical protein [Oscillospiraceae bacterium]